MATWPNRFTDNFSIWMKNDEGRLQIEDIGLERLDEYDLWLQVIDETGQEVFSHNKPENFPAKYTASELMAFSTSDYEDGNTVFVSSFEENGQTWNYLIGFPYDVGKYMLYYNGEVIGRLKPVFTLSLFGVIFAGSALFLIYGIWLTRQTGKIAKGIGNISRRVYNTIPEKGTFGSIYMALNKMDEEIRHSDQIKEETDRVRREWITNITHDLKTPLSPVKGYAELLADGTDVDAKAAQEYGTIILKNVDYAEKLMNDLKLTYQLESGAFPFHPQQVRLVRYLKELVIDIANDPTFSNRDIEFESESNLSELTVAIDPDLFRRAVGNLVVNALVHNPPDTKVIVSVSEDKQKGIAVAVVVIIIAAIMIIQPYNWSKKSFEAVVQETVTQADGEIRLIVERTTEIYGDPMNSLGISEDTKLLNASGEEIATPDFKPGDAISVSLKDSFTEETPFYYPIVYEIKLIDQ